MPKIRSAFATISVFLISASPTVLAATYRCDDGGRTVYQAQPCSGDASVRSREIKVDPPPSRATSPGLPAGPRASPASDAAPVIVAARPGLPPGVDITAFGRRAFERLVTGIVDAWIASLCPESKVRWDSAWGRDAIAQQKAFLAGNKATLGAMIGSGPVDVTFRTIEQQQPGLPAGKRFQVNVGDDAGRACVSGWIHG